MAASGIAAEAAAAAAAHATPAALASLAALPAIPPALAAQPPAAAAVEQGGVGPLKVEEMLFNVEQHGYQCLVYRHRARKTITRAVGDVTWVTQVCCSVLRCVAV